MPENGFKKRTSNEGSNQRDGNTSTSWGKKKKWIF